MIGEKESEEMKAFREETRRDECVVLYCAVCNRSGWVRRGEEERVCFTVA
jgi:hypothetical protein